MNVCSISLCSWKEHCHVIYRESKKFAEEYFQAQISNSKPYILLKHKSTFFFLTHRAAPNTQPFHQIRKKNWTTFHLWFAKMDTKSVMCPLKKGNIFGDLVSSKSLRVSDWLLHAVLFKSITKKCMTCSSAPTVLSIGKLAGAWCVYSWNL